MKEENNVLKLINEEGKEITCDVLFTFDSEENNKSYIVYTDNTTDDTGSTKVYASIYDKSGQNSNLMPIETEEEWNLIENILSSIQEKVDAEENEDS